jgi:hypothetical protein
MAAFCVSCREPRGGWGRFCSKCGATTVRRRRQRNGQRASLRYCLHSTGNGTTDKICLSILVFSCC